MLWNIIFISIFFSNSVNTLSAARNNKAHFIRYIFFNVTNSVFGALDLIDEADGCECDIYSLDLDALYVYYKDPICDFDEFLIKLQEYEAFGGSDFEEYYDLVFRSGLLPEDAVKGIDVTDEDLEQYDLTFEKNDSFFDKWAEEENDFSDKIDEEYDSDNPCYSDEEDEDIE